MQNRNDRGIQLIEREEEVCVFYERHNIQDQMIRNGDVELKGREEEIRFLNMQVTEEKRSIGLLRKNTPNQKAMEQELVTLQIQVWAPFCLTSFHRQKCLIRIHCFF